MSCCAKSRHLSEIRLRRNMYRAYSVKRQELRSGGRHNRPHKIWEPDAAINYRLRRLRFIPHDRRPKKPRQGIAPCRGSSGEPNLKVYYLSAKLNMIEELSFKVIW